MNHHLGGNNDEDQSIRYCNLYHNHTFIDERLSIKGVLRPGNTGRTTCPTISIHPIIRKINHGIPKLQYPCKKHIQRRINKKDKTYSTL